MAITNSSTVSRLENCMVATVDDELVVVSLDSNAYIAMDDIGRNIWDLLETPHSVEALCAELQQAYDGDKAEICADLLLFLQELEKEGLLKVADGKNR